MIVKIGDRSYKSPDNWNECTNEQLLACYQILMTPLGRIFEESEQLLFQRIECMKILLRLSEEDLKDWQEESLDHETFFDQMYQVAKAVTGFMFQPVPDQENQFQLNLNLTRNPFPELQYFNKKGKRRKLYGPADALNNLTIYELGMAFMALENFLKEQAEDHVDTLLSILYRPGKMKTKENKLSDYQGDRRLPLLNHESTITKREKKMKRLPMQVRQLLVLWFASCRQQIIESWPNIFSSSSVQQEEGNDYAWGGLLLDLAGGLSHLDQVSQQPYATALTYLSMLEDRRKQQERELLRKKHQRRGV